VLRLSSVCRLSVYPTECMWVGKRCVLSRSYYWLPIWSRIWEIDWYQHEWHWPLFRGPIKVMWTIALHSTLDISETVRDRALVPKDH